MIPRVAPASVQQVFPILTALVHLTDPHSMRAHVTASAMNQLLHAVERPPTSMQATADVSVTQLRTHAHRHTQSSMLLLADATAQQLLVMMERLAVLAKSGINPLAHANAQPHNKSAMAELYGTTNSVPASALPQVTALLTQESPSTTLTMSVLASVTPPSQDAEHSLLTTLPMSATVNVF